MGRMFADLEGKKLPDFTVGEATLVSMFGDLITSNVHDYITRITDEAKAELTLSVQDIIAIASIIASALGQGLDAQCKTIDKLYARKEHAHSTEEAS